MKTIKTKIFLEVKPAEILYGIKKNWIKYLEQKFLFAHTTIATAVIVLGAETTTYTAPRNAGFFFNLFLRP